MTTHDEVWGSKCPNNPAWSIFAGDDWFMFMGFTWYNHDDKIHCIKLGHVGPYYPHTYMYIPAMKRGWQLHHFV